MLEESDFVLGMILPLFAVGIPGLVVWVGSKWKRTTDTEEVEMATYGTVNGLNGMTKDDVTTTTIYPKESRDTKALKLLARVNHQHTENSGHVKGCRGIHCRMHEELFPMVKNLFCLTTWAYTVEGFEDAHMCKQCVDQLTKLADVGAVRTHKVFATI